jgi:hypothetical protein
MFMAISPVSFRIAAPQDAPAAGELLVATMGTSGEVVFGNNDHSRAVSQLGRLFALPGHRMSYQWSHLAIVDGQVAGMLVSFPGARLDALSVRLLKPLLRVFSLPGLLGVIWRGLPLLMGRETNADEYYIAHIAVAPHRQRQGVATALLAKAYGLAAELGLRKVSLVVDRENQPARLVYDKAGFRVVQEVRQP